MSTATTPAITNLAAVIVPVADQDRMVEFYTEALGLEKGTDVPFGEGVEGRWVEVAPSGAETPIALCPPGPDNEAGGRETGISLRTADIKAYHAQLKERGWTWRTRSAKWASPFRRSSGSVTLRGTS